VPIKRLFDRREGFDKSDNEVETNLSLKRIKTHNNSGSDRNIDWISRFGSHNTRDL
jgi:hypothetical protein